MIVILLLLFACVFLIGAAYIFFWLRRSYYVLESHLGSCLKKFETQLAGGAAVGTNLAAKSAGVLDSLNSTAQSLSGSADQFNRGMATTFRLGTAAGILFIFACFLYVCERMYKLVCDVMPEAKNYVPPRFLQFLSKVLYLCAFFSGCGHLLQLLCNVMKFDTFVRDLMTSKTLEELSDSAAKLSGIKPNTDQVSAFLPVHPEPKGFVRPTTTSSPTAAASGFSFDTTVTDSLFSKLNESAVAAAVSSSSQQALDLYATYAQMRKLYDENRGVAMVIAVCFSISVLISSYLMFWRMQKQENEEDEARKKIKAKAKPRHDDSQGNSDASSDTSSVFANQDFDRDDFLDDRVDDTPFWVSATGSNWADQQDTDDLGPLYERCKKLDGEISALYEKWKKIDKEELKPSPRGVAVARMRKTAADMRKIFDEHKDLLKKPNECLTTVKVRGKTITLDAYKLSLSKMTEKGLAEALKHVVDDFKKKLIQEEVDTRKKAKEILDKNRASLEKKLEVRHVDSMPAILPAHCVVKVETDSSIGCGFSLRKRIVTAAHCVKNGHATVKFNGFAYDMPFSVDSNLDFAISNDWGSKFPGLKDLQHTRNDAALAVGKQCIAYNGDAVSPGAILAFEGETIIHSCSTRDGWSGCPVLLGGEVFVHSAGGAKGNVAIRIPKNLNAPGGSQ